MTKWNEAKLTKYLKDQCAKNHILFWKMSDRYTSGRPDCLLMYEGEVRFVELKAWDKKPKPIQYKIGRDLDAHGCLWSWHGTKEGVDRLIEEIVG